MPKSNVTVFGGYVEPDDGNVIGRLTLCFQSGSLNMDELWESSLLSASFLSTFWGKFFPEHGQDSDIAREKMKDAVHYICSELLGNAVKFSYNSDYMIEISYGGQAQMMAEMNRTITAILAFAVFFSFVVLAVQFNSLKMPLLILGSVPFCVAGMAYALYLTGLPMGATVLIGLLVVVASTVNEGVLLLTYTEELRSHQLSAFEAIVQAAKIRFRPRMMISFCVIAGLIPLALNIEEGGDMLQPMAVAAIGGLGLGIFVALFLVPCLYVFFSRNVPTID